MFTYDKGASSDWCNDESVNLYEDEKLTKVYENDAQKVSFNQNTNGDILTQEVILHTTNWFDEIVLYLGRETKGGV